ncbi:ribonuclease Z [Candidatus Bathyarchaeota archaeon]|nr:ribonuclease Z [Candidatus Bathyarchaeota archaeon]
MKVVFLGTSGSMPTPRRGSSSVAVKLGRDLVMFDCGEGTQRQMVRAGVGFRRETKILVSHLHGDHTLGLPGLLQTMSLLRRERPLEVYGPTGIIQFIKAFSESLGGPTFPVIINELQEPGVVHSEAKLEIVAIRSRHMVESWSYGLFEKPRPGRFHPDKARALGVPEGKLWHTLQHGEPVTIDGRNIQPSQVTDPPRPGRRIVYSGDTRPFDGLVELARGADLLIHESTFSHELAERAEEDGHSTAVEAASVARDAGVKRLALTHLSSRYSDPAVLLDEAKQVFENVFVAEDLMELELPLPR